MHRDSRLSCIHIYNKVLPSPSLCIEISLNQFSQFWSTLDISLCWQHETICYLFLLVHRKTVSNKNLSSKYQKSLCWVSKPLTNTACFLPTQNAVHLSLSKTQWSVSTGSWDINMLLGMLSRTGYVTQLLSQKSSGLALKTMLVFLSFTFWHILMASSLVNFFLFSVKRCRELVCSGTVTGPRILARIRELVLWMLICGFIWQTQLAWYQTQLV